MPYGGGVGVKHERDLIHEDWTEKHYGMGPLEELCMDLH